MASPFDIGDDGATMFMYGGVDPTDESQITRMRAKIDETYMLFVYAHTLDKTVYEPDAPLSDSDDETLAFGPPFSRDLRGDLALRGVSGVHPAVGVRWQA